MSLKLKTDYYNYRLITTSEILLTSEHGDRLSPQPNTEFRFGQAEGVVVHVDPENVRQTLHGIGTSFTESAAFVLAHLETDKRAEVMAQIFGEEGANFSMARTPIGSCDFCVEGRYCYAPIAADFELENFSVEPDLDGFDTQRFPGIKGPTFDLLPMIQQALNIKRQQQDSTLNIVASAWTAPPWMKDIDDWYVPGNAENNYNGSGGELKPEYAGLYASYLDKYLDAYRQQGVEIWGITPVNEPLGNSGQWESMHFTAETQNEFIKNHLGPTLRAGNNKDVQLLIYDHSRDQLEQWADAIYGDPVTAHFVQGAAVHWYESTFKVFEDVLERVHQKHPGYSIIHSEGCIDNLGNEAPQGVLDPARYKETNWFDNDDFWWNDNATDYAYTATWPGINSDDHPIYTPVHRYARNIIQSLNHWIAGWIDWNIVLDQRGGPNHVGNYCGAPIMIDTNSGHVYYTPIFHVLTQFSRTMRPGDRVLSILVEAKHLAEDDLHACATINRAHTVSVQLLNTTKKSLEVNLQVGNQYAPVAMPANALQTVRFQLVEAA